MKLKEVLVGFFLAIPLVLADTSIINPFTVMISMLEQLRDFILQVWTVYQTAPLAFEMLWLFLILFYVIHLVLTKVVFKTFFEGKPTKESIVLAGVIALIGALGIPAIVFGGQMDFSQSIIFTLFPAINFKIIFALSFIVFLVPRVVEEKHRIWVYPALYYPIDLILQTLSSTYQTALANEPNFALTVGFLDAAALYYLIGFIIIFVGGKIKESRPGGGAAHP